MEADQDRRLALHPLCQRKELVALHQRMPHAVVQEYVQSVSASLLEAMQLLVHRLRLHTCEAVC